MPISNQPHNAEYPAVAPVAGFKLPFLRSLTLFKRLLRLARYLLLDVLTAVGVDLLGLSVNVFLAVVALGDIEAEVLRSLAAARLYAVAVFVVVFHSYTS